MRKLHLAFRLVGKDEDIQNDYHREKMHSISSLHILVLTSCNTVNVSACSTNANVTRGPSLAC